MSVLSKKGRIEACFERLNEEKRAALITFISAGDPDYETSLKILLSLPDSGADIVELGMPFTDPMADGPSVQAAGLRASAPRDVIVLDVRDRPGVLGEVCRKAADAGVNLTVTYLATDTRLVLGADDLTQLRAAVGG